jgi:SAM-dependent methyltransferase
MTDFLWQDRDKKKYVYSFESRPECLSMIERAPTVALDIGCGSGGVGHALRRRFPGCELWGCELDAAAAQRARRHFDHVVEQDVGKADFTALGLKQPFDLVCMLDVLEHLFNPWQLLHDLQRQVSANAHLLVSLPNASNIALLYDALQGHWKYRRWGLLDFTHLRFFTDFDARKMFYQAGYRVLKHNIQLLGRGQDHVLYKSLANASFPTTITLGDMTLRVKSREHLQNLCAAQNIYLITPHHGQFINDEERELASNRYPRVNAFGNTDIRDVVSFPALWRKG